MSEDFGMGFESAESVVDNNVADTQEVSEGTETSEGTEGTAEQTEKLQAPADNVESSPNSIRNSLKKAMESNPELSKELKTATDSYFREQAYKKIFETTEAATQAKEIIEAAGGLDGISQIRERISSYDAQDSALREGNPEVLDAMFKDFPEGAAALAPHYLDKLAESNPQAFQSAVTPYAVQLLIDSNFPAYMKAIGSETDPGKIQQYAQELSKWFTNQYTNAKQLIDGRTNIQNNPQMSKIQQERQALDTEKESMYKSSIADKYRASTETELNNEITKYSKQYSLNTKQQETYKQLLLDRVWKEMENDEGYKKQLNLRYENAKKDKSFDSVSNYAANSFNQRMKTASLDIAKQLWGNPKTNVSNTGTGVIKSTTPKTAANGGPVKVSQRPAQSSIDESKTTDLDLIRGQAWTKSGHFVKWR